MKAFLLAGGYGTRLRPLTDSLPKCLVPIQGKPLLDIWLDLCARSNITEVLINLHAHSRLVEEHLKEKCSPVAVSVVHEKQLLGSAGTIAANREWINSDPAFWILYSDVLTNMDLRRMTEFHVEHETVATLGLYQVPDPSRCGVALTDSSGIITDFEEKPTNPRSNWVFSGLMLASPRFLDFIPPTIPADIAFDVLPRLLGRLLAYPINDYLLDIGTMQNYQKAQNTWPGMDSVSAPSDRVALPSPASSGKAL
ncbi:MAG: nucleotidyltransferase family protein [Candidatus Sulfotelmatobacter sp.]